MLEVLVAFVIATLMVVTVMTTFAWSIAKQTERLRDLWLTEFARSVLVEYSQAFPDMAKSGVDPGGWHWELSEGERSPNPPSPLDAEMLYLEVTARVWNDARPKQVKEVSGLQARRRN